VSTLKVPAPHAVKSPPSGPVYPAFATQALTAADADEPAVLELRGQLVHPADEVPAALYVLAAHADTLLPLPVYPALAKHELCATVPISVPVPELSGQSSHAAVPVAALNCI
jgi:hypothetical protein